MRLLRAVLFNLFFYLATALMALAAVPLLAAPPRWLVRYGRWWTRLTMAGLRRIVGLDYRVEGLDGVPSGPLLIAAKHQSAWDTLIYRLLVDDFVPVMKRELALIPVWGWQVRHAGAICVDRSGGPAALRRLVRDARAAIEQGWPILIFPEGTRVAPGARRPYHSGIAAMYGELGVPVVPVAVNSGLFWPRRKLFGQRPGCITIRFLPPIPPGLTRRHFLERLETAIESATDELLTAARQGDPTSPALDGP